MNRQQNRDLAIEFDRVCRQLRQSGYDLSRIKLATTVTHNIYYVTKRIEDDARIRYNEN